MADFLDKIKGTIDKGISTVNVKSKELIEKQKGRHRLSELEAKKKTALENLGRMTYSTVSGSGVSGVGVISKITSSGSGGAHVLNLWEQTVLDVLHHISEGKNKKILFDITDK